MPSFPFPACPLRIKFNPTVYLSFLTFFAPSPLPSFPSLQGQQENQCRLTPPPPPAPSPPPPPPRVDVGCEERGHRARVTDHTPPLGSARRSSGCLLRDREGRGEPTRAPAVLQRAELDRTGPPDGGGGIRRGPTRLLR